MKVGDRVKVKDKFCGTDLKGKTGTIVYVFGTRVGVDFDEPFPEGHNCDGRAKSGNGRYGQERELELLTPFKVGDRVRAIAAVDGYKNLIGKTGTVVSIESTLRVGVDFDESFNGGHACGGMAKEYNGRYADAKCFELLKEIETSIEEVRSATVKLDLPPEFAYVARDMDGLLFAYVDKPKRDVGGKQWYGERFKKLNDSLCPDLKWTDEPYEVRR